MAKDIKKKDGKKNTNDNKKLGKHQDKPTRKEKWVL